MTELPMLAPERPAPDVTAFKQIAGRIASGCAIVTTVDDAGRPQGLVVTAITALSLDPMQFLVCLDRKSNTLAAIRQSGILALNLLAAEQEGIARAFATKRADKFAGLDLIEHDGPLPVLAGTLGYVVCEIADLVTSGDHEIVVCAPLRMASFEGEPLIHFRGAFRTLQPGSALSA